MMRNTTRTVNQIKIRARMKQIRQATGGEAVQLWKANAPFCATESHMRRPVLPKTLKMRSGLPTPCVVNLMSGEAVTLLSTMTGTIVPVQFLSRFIMREFYQHRFLPV